MNRNARRNAWVLIATLALLGALFTCVKHSSLFADMVRIEWNDSGLRSISYKGREYLSYGAFNLIRVEFAGQDGKPAAANLRGHATVDPHAETITTSYDWGSVKARYHANNNRLLIDVRVMNSSPLDIQALAFEPLRLRFSAKPTQFDGTIPILADNIGGPSALTMSTPRESLVLTNEEIKRPLLIGFPWTLNKPANTEFPLRVVTGREPMYPDSLPLIPRPIAHGATDEYKLALRFGSAQHNALNLTEDLYERVRTSYPSTLHWDDRRPIGSLILGTANAKWAHNPRGWFLDASLNVTGPGGADRFREPLMGWVDRSIRVLKEMNAQGMITWDIEGEQYAHPLTYVGDPRQMETLAPEMAPWADEYFERFRDAGLRVGVAIRPQQFTLSTDHREASQDPVADPAALLTAKIRYAKQRWGATLFYIDSNGDQTFPMDSDILRKVADQNPDVLLIPEHCSLLYYAFSAPYRELRKGVTSTPELVRSVYPDAFSVINTPDGGIAERKGKLAEALRDGDLLMFRGWYADPGNAIVHQLYEANDSRDPQ